MIRQLFGNQIRNRPLIDPDTESITLSGNPSQDEVYGWLESQGIGAESGNQVNQALEGAKNKAKKRNPKMDLFTAPPKPDKGLFLDQKDLQKKRDNVRRTGRVGALSTAISAIADMAQLGNRTAMPTTQYGANLTTNANELVELLRQQEQQGLNQYNNALLNWQNQANQVQNQNAQQNYNETVRQEENQRQDEREEANRKEREKGRFLTGYYSMLNRGMDVDAINDLAKRYDMPELTSEWINNLQDPKNKKVTGLNGGERVYQDPMAEMGRHIIMQSIIDDPYSFINGDPISSGANAVDQLSKEDKITYYKRIAQQYEQQTAQLESQLTGGQISIDQAEQMANELVDRYQMILIEDEDGGQRFITKPEAQELVRQLLQGVQFPPPQGQGQAPQGQQSMIQPQQANPNAVANTGSHNIATASAIPGISFNRGNSGGAVQPEPVAQPETVQNNVKTTDIDNRIASIQQAIRHEQGKSQPNPNKLKKLADALNDLQSQKGN